MKSRKGDWGIKSAVAQNTNQILANSVKLGGVLYANRPRRIIEIWSPGHGWTKLGGGTTSIADDTAVYKTGYQGLRINATDANCSARKDVAFDARANIGLDLYVEEASDIECVSIFLDTTGSDMLRYFGYDYPGISLRSGWNRILLSCYSFTMLGAESYDELAGVNHVRITLVRSGCNRASVVLDRLYTSPLALDKGKVTLTFDDAYSNTYTVAKPILDTYGMSGVVYTITNFVGTDTYMTLGQLQELQELGWDVSSHTKTHGYFISDNKTDEQIRDELGGSKNWLTANGFAKGARHFAAPGGEYNNHITNIIKEYYATHRSIVGGDEPYPDVNPYGLRVLLATNGSTADFVNDSIDFAAAYHTWLILCFHLIMDPADTSTKFSEAAFRTVMEHLASSDVDVVTMSDML